MTCRAPRARLYVYNPRTQPLARACPTRAQPRAAHALRRAARQAVRRRWEERDRGPDLDGGLRLRPPPLAARRRRSRARRRDHMTGAGRGRLLLRARRAATDGPRNYATAERYDPERRRRWQRLPSMRRSARRDRLGGGQPRARRGVRRRGLRHRQTIREVELFEPRRAALARAARHAHAAPRARRRVAAQPRLLDRRAARAPASSSRTRSSSSTSTDACSRSRTTSPRGSFPVLTRRPGRDQRGRCSSCSRGLLRQPGDLRHAGDRLRRDPLRDHPSRRCSARRRTGAMPARGRRASTARRPTSRPTWLTLLTSMFMHGGLLHLGGNMLFLWIFGNNIEDSMGRARFLAFYLLGGLVAVLAQTVIDPDVSGADHRRERGRGGGARRLRAAVSPRPGRHAAVHHHLLHDRRAAGAAGARRPGSPCRRSSA